MEITEQNEIDVELHNAFTALEQATEAVEGFGCLYTAMRKTSQEDSQGYLDVAMETIMRHGGMMGPSTPTQEGLKETLVAFWRGLMALIRKARDAAMKWTQSVMDRVSNISTRSRQLLKYIEARETTEDIFGSKYADALKFRSTELTIKRAELFLRDGKPIGMSLQGIEALADTLTGDTMLPTIIDKAEDLIKVIQNADIREEADLVEFVKDYDEIVKETNEQIIAKAGGKKIEHEGNGTVYFVPLANYPNESGFTVHVREDSLPVRIEFQGPQRYGVDQTAYVRAMPLDDVKDLVRTIAKAGDEVGRVKRNYKAMVELDDRVLDVGKRFVSKLEKSVYDDTQYETDMRRGLEAMNIVARNSRTTFVGFVRNATLTLSAAYNFALEAYQNVIVK